MRFDHKELTNPLILLPLILLAVYLFGGYGQGLLVHSFLIFFLSSIILNIVLVLTKTVKKRLYLFVYFTFFSYLIILVPLFYLLGLQHPILHSFFVLGVTDFIIQAYYNVVPRKDGKELIRLWGNKLAKSERMWLHPISLQKYIFKGFTASIVDSEAINPTNLHISHLRPLRYEKIPSHIYNHQYGGDSYLFTLHIRDKKRQPLDSDGNKTIDGLKVDPILLKSLRQIDRETGKHIITAYKQGSNITAKDLKHLFAGNDSAVVKGYDNLKISIEKGYVLKNPRPVYAFLRKCSGKYD